MSSAPGLVLQPLAIPGWWCPEGLQCCRHDALEQHRNMGRPCLARLVALMLLGLPAVPHSQQEQPEACAYRSKIDCKSSSRIS